MEEKIESIIAQNLIELRKSRNLKQTELSDAVGYSDKTISRWENGTSVPDISTLVRLAEFYNVSLEDLITENAVNKTSKKDDEKNRRERFIGSIGMIILSVVTVWVFVVLIYVGLVMFQNLDLWELFLWAIPVSSVIAYRGTRKQFKLKWLNFVLLSITVIGLATAAYLQCIRFDFWFWQVFILIIPLEGMVAISSLIPKEWRKLAKRTNKEDKEEKIKVKKEENQ